MVDVWSDFYNDTFSTRGLIPKEDDDGTTNMVDGEILSDIPCRISYSKDDKSDGKSIDGNFKSVVTKIFTGLESKVLKGDKVIAHKVINDITVCTYEGIASQPNYYPDHQEFILEDKEGA